MSRRRWQSIRRFALSTPTLKAVNIILALLICIETPRILYTFQEWNLYFTTVRNYNQKSRNVKATPWADVNILRPPPLSNLTIEALRLNELLASAGGDAKGACAIKRRYGIEMDSFSACQDDQFSALNESQSEGSKKVKAFLLTNRKHLRGEFEKSLNIPYWIVYAPKHSNIFESLVVDLEINNLAVSDKNPDEYTVPIADVKAELKRYQFAAAKIDLADTNGQGQRAHALLQEILPEMQSEQLFVVIHLERRDANSVFNWYSSLFDILLKGKFVLLNTESSGACGADIEHFGNCEYRVTLIDRKKIPHHAVMAPTFGLGSPAEEKYRLINYLNSKNSGCTSDADFDQILISCKSTTKTRLNTKKCSSLIYIRYRTVPDQKTWNEMAHKMGFICSDFQLFYPHEINPEIQISTSLKHHALGVSPKNYSQKFLTNIFDDQKVWRLEPLKEILNLAQLRTYTVNWLVFDLDGGEWTILDNLLQNISFCAILRNFERIIFRLRVWMSEEAKNFRRLYSNLISLEKECEFSKIYVVSYDHSTYGVIFERNNIIL